MSNGQWPMANGRCTSTATGYREMHISVPGPWYKLYMRVVRWDLVLGLDPEGFAEASIKFTER
jgi:hypothetical protein